MERARVLIACIGNIFLGDDGFGVEVARHLMGRPFPPGVRVVDFGIRALDLTYALVDGCDSAILVDAVPKGGRPGTIYVIEPELPPPSIDLDPATMEQLDGHTMDPVKVLRIVAQMGGRLERVFVVGCEPAPLPENPEEQMGLSKEVQAAIGTAVAAIESMVSRLLSETSDVVKY